MTSRIQHHGLQIDAQLYQLINQDVLPRTGITQEVFWANFSRLFSEFTPQNQALLAKRELLQAQIDKWHLSHQQQFDQQAYERFLTEIGYLHKEVDDFTITTCDVDDEVALIAGPQLVVPIMNARYALNAANARWGSLYDALYGTDVIDKCGESGDTLGYDPVRGAKVISFAKNFLDHVIPLSQGSHSDVVHYSIVNEKLRAKLNNHTFVSLRNTEKLRGYVGSQSEPKSLLFKNNNLHIDIQIDHQHGIGKGDPAGIKDVILEAAISTIQDCEDSVAAVDGQDKVLVYRNWLGLMQGNLTEKLQKGGKKLLRALNPDRQYLDLHNQSFTLPGRSLLFVRNVGHLMTTNAILDAKGNEVPEGIMDGMITSLIAIHDLAGNSEFCNSPEKSVYIVKPKMHGPEEVAFCNSLFARIEEYLDLRPFTLKIGIMDEERRTSANLKNCIYAAKNRVAFINTGFLDRTGDEIHTSMHAGPMVPKDQMKEQAWLLSYEQRNVNIGLRTGLKGKAQIGKGMWAVPDNMAQMLREKVAHPLAGASCAWVPSPTAAVLHVLHYHQVNVAEVQEALAEQVCATQTDLLTLPLLSSSLPADVIQQELDNNVQGLLGYVVRWIDAGIGCSKVPDINNVGKMEDRATLRIASQHIANWLLHGILNEEQIMASLRKMAVIVDGQNNATPDYHNMSPNFDQSIAFKAATDLIFKGTVQPSGYTEPLLHERRLALKASL
jgi:malate synthase